MKRARKVAWSAANDDGPRENGAAETLWVAGDREVAEFADSGRCIRRHRTPRSARAVAALPEGKLLVAQLNSILQLGRSGELEARWQAPDNAVFSSLAVWNGQVLGADAGSGVIWKWNLDGAFQGAFSDTRFAAPAEFFDVVASANFVHANSPGRHRIASMHGNGEQKREWGSAARTLAGFSGCCNPVSFTVLTNGDFVTAERGVPRVKRFSADGKFKQLLFGPEAFVENQQASNQDQAATCQAGGLDVASVGSKIALLDRVTGQVAVSDLS